MKEAGSTNRLLLPALILLGGLVVVGLAAGGVLTRRSRAAGPELGTGQLVVETTPAARVAVDGQVWDAEPVPAGRHTLTLSAPGYDPIEQAVNVAPGQTVTVKGTLVDTTPPGVSLRAVPTVSERGTPVAVWLEVTDRGSRPAGFRLSVDGEAMKDSGVVDGQPVVTGTLHLAGLDVGLHRLDLAASDAAGNSITTTLYVEVVEAAPQTTRVEIPPPGEVRVADRASDPSAGQVLTATQSVPTAVIPSPYSTTVITGSQIVTRSESYTATTVGEDRAACRRETLTLSTYAYEQALVTSSSDFPYPTLDVNRMGPPRPKSYQAVILENDALRLTLLPELGGRLYQVMDKATGRDLLYNNPVVKPTRWGPPEMNWWLAAGGMEWAFPVEEHGYAWGMPWGVATSVEADGSAVASLSYRDSATNLAAEVVVSLPASGKAFSVAPTLINEGVEATTGQLWVNAALPAGPGMQVELPATRVKVHSAGKPEGVEVGQVLAWDAGVGDWGRWRTWFGAFAAPATSGLVEVWGQGDGPGLRREFEPAAAPGVKVFTWGPEANTAEFEGSPYLEVWGGLTPDFDMVITLAPGERRGWSETWTVIDR